MVETCLVVFLDGIASGVVVRGSILVGCGVAIALTLSGCFATDPTSSAPSPEPTVTVTVTATPTPDPVPSTDPTDQPTTPPTDEPTATPTPTPTPTTAPGRTNVPVKVTLSEIEDDIQQLHFAVTMSGIAEEGGVCTATATKSSKKVTVSQKAEYNVNRTECGGLRFALADLSKGSWKVTVSYLSKKYSGTSAVTTVKVP